MAWPVALGTALSTAQGLGSASGGTSDQGGAGLGYKILGAPGDPAGVIYKMLMDRNANKMAEDQFNKKFGLESDKWGMDKKLLMQQFIAQQRKLDWQKQLMDRLMQGK